MTLFVEQPLAKPVGLLNMYAALWLLPGNLNVSFSLDTSVARSQDFYRAVAVTTETELNTSGDYDYSEEEEEEGEVEYHSDSSDCWW